MGSFALGSLALGEKFGAGWEVWPWVESLALGGGSYKFLYSSFNREEAVEFNILQN